MNKKYSYNEVKYKSQNPFRRFLIHIFISKIISLIREIKPDTILDAGCGEGFIAERILKEFPKIKYTGIDSSIEAIVKVRQKLTDSRFIKSDIIKMPFKSSAFDLVISSEVLEHLPKPEEGLSEIYRVTKKTALLTVPDEPVFSYLRMLSGQNVLNLGRHPEHINMWNSESFPSFIKLQFAKIKLIKSLPWLICLAYK